MAYISFQPSDFFNTVLYTGTGSELAITGAGFQPDMVWLKVRNTTGHHQVFDAARGGTKVIYPSQNDAEATIAESLKTFDSDGFTLGTGSYVNTNTNTYASWNWKAGTTSGIATDGSTTITPSSYSFDQTVGISIIKYTGNSTSGAKLAHGLGVVPKFICVKNLDAAEGWTVYHEALGNTKYLALNTTAATDTQTNRWNDTSPDSVNITLGDSSGVNTQTYIAYCFADIKGYSNFGSYTGNGNADGPFIYTGFRPAWILLKISNTTGDWYMYDTKRLGYNIDNDSLFPNSTQATATSDDLDILSNGFKMRSTNGQINGSGNTIQYMAFAEFPIVGKNKNPGLAR